MTPQEQQLVDELFDRLSKLENSPRDPEAERLIADGARRAPHAAYALVQTVLVQDEVLRRANARIEDLQAQLGGADQSQQQRGFLDGMRDSAALGRSRQAPGSVPSVRPPPVPQPGLWNQQPQASYPPQQAAAPAAAAPQAAAPGFGGGSFLATAASAAAGVIGGSLLLDGIRSMFGHHSYFGQPSSFADSQDRGAFTDTTADSANDYTDTTADTGNDNDYTDTTADDANDYAGDGSGSDSTFDV